MRGNDALGLRCLYHSPITFARRVIGVEPDAAQCRIMDSVANNQMTSVRSGHGVGKSAVESWLILWYLCTRSYPKIPCTAPTEHQLKDILWAEIAKWIRKSSVLENKLAWTKDRVFLKGCAKEWFAVARTATKPDALQGFHAENVFYVIDEASGVDDDRFEPVLGSLSTAGAKLLMCGNPTQLSGFFYESHHKNRAHYQAHHIDGRHSSLVSREYVDTIINMYGEDSDVFRVRVAGEFPMQEDDIFIPLSLIERSIMSEAPKRATPDRIHIGCDVARFGDDKTVIGYKVDERVTIHKKINGQDLMQTANDIIELGEMLVRRYAFENKIPVKVDDGGVGGGVVDRLRQLAKNNPDKLWWLDVVPVKFGERIRHRDYHDSTSYMMGIVKKLLMPRDEDGSAKPVELILPDDANLVAQLSTRRYTLTENSKIRVESKMTMKKRGLPSPDEADCVLLLCLPLRKG